jgi:hypothetical protein
METRTVLAMPGDVMALDRPDDDFEVGDARPEQHLRDRTQGSDVPAARSEPAEPRTHEEYYEALRAADGGRLPEGDDPAADVQPDRSGWDSVDATNRPVLDSFRVSPERCGHILDGDAVGGGGGHRHGVGKPGKTEFPASWDDEKVIASVLDVARKPDKPPTRQDWNDTWLCTGSRDNVEVSTVVERSGDILTGWPEEGGPGVVRNPRKGNHDRN